MKILHLDTNHPALLEQLNAAGFENHKDYTSSKVEVEKKIQPGVESCKLQASSLSVNTIK